MSSVEFGATHIYETVHKCYALEIKLTCTKCNRREKTLYFIKQPGVYHYGCFLCTTVYRRHLWIEDTWVYYSLEEAKTWPWNIDLTKYEQRTRDCWKKFYERS